MTLLHQGTSILDTVYKAGYYDQSHMTNSLKRFLGQTPAQITSLPKFVVSTTLKAPLAWNAALIKGDIAREVAKLKQQPGQDISAIMLGTPAISPH
jgi:AraC-like DNA-binding protein